MLKLVKKSSIKQFVVYCFGCKEKWENGVLKERGGRGVNKFHALEREGLLEGVGLF